MTTGSVITGVIGVPPRRGPRAEAIVTRVKIPRRRRVKDFLEFMIEGLVVINGEVKQKHADYDVRGRRQSRGR